MSNKTLKGNAKKTKSAPKYLLIGIIVCAILLFASIGLYISSTKQIESSSSQNPQTVKTDSACLKTDQSQSQCVATMEIADTASEQTQGLSGRASMNDDQGMLFVFDQASSQCFWMKDMNFSLDMIWLNDQKEVVKIAKSVAPETYPNEFCSEKPATYVIELTSGSAGRLGISEGQKLVF